MKHDFIENNIIMLSKQTIDAFLKSENPSDLIGLYCFYYYTAKWQKTNQPKATTSFCAKGLKWGKDKIRDRKQELIKLGLIEDIKDIDEKTGKIKGWYIKVKYIWKEENHPTNLPEGGLNHSVESKGTNALSANTKNALNINKEIHVEIENIIKSFETINPACKRMYGNTTQRRACSDLIENYGFDRVMGVIEKTLPRTNKIGYMPTITTPVQLFEKWSALEAGINKFKDKQSNKGIADIRQQKNDL